MEKTKVRKTKTRICIQCLRSALSTDQRAVKAYLVSDSYILVGPPDCDMHGETSVEILKAIGFNPDDCEPDIDLREVLNEGL